MQVLVFLDFASDRRAEARNSILNFTWHVDLRCLHLPVRCISRRPQFRAGAFESPRVSLAVLLLKGEGAGVHAERCGRWRETDASCYREHRACGCGGSIIVSARPMPRLVATGRPAPALQAAQLLEQRRLVEQRHAARVDERYKF